MDASAMSNASPITRRRALVAEGRLLVGSILGTPPGRGAISRYVIGVERFQDGIPLAVPAVVRFFPILIRAFEPVGSNGSRFAQRLALAMRVAEATPRGAALMHPHVGSGPIRALVRLAAVGLTEALLLPLRLVLGRRW